MSSSSSLSSSAVSRRDLLKQLGTAGAGLLLAPQVIRGSSPADIMVAGKPVEIVVASPSPNTVRITVVPIDANKAGTAAAAVPVDGALAQVDLGKTVARASGTHKFTPV